MRPAALVGGGAVRDTSRVLVSTLFEETKDVVIVLMAVIDVVSIIVGLEAVGEGEVEGGGSSDKRKRGRWTLFIMTDNDQSHPTLGHRISISIPPAFYPTVLRRWRKKANRPFDSPRELLRREFLDKILQLLVVHVDVRRVKRADNIVMVGYGNISRQLMIK